MSIIKVQQIVDRKNKPLLNSSGSIIQTVFARTDSVTSYSALITGDGTPITELSISVTPKSGQSILLMQWMLTHETGENSVFLIHRNNSLITTNPAGLNNSVVNSRWVGYAPAVWDGDNNSTLNNTFITYSQPALSTDHRTYTLAVRSSGPLASTFALNRTLGNTGQDTFENGVSVGVLYEIVV